MPRRARIHVPGGTYYVVRRTGSSVPLFLDADEYALLDHLLATALIRAHARLHGYCWMPDAMHFVLTIDRSPLGAFMSELTCRYSYQVCRRRCEPGSLFRGRYRATLVEPETYLLPLIHYLHYLPVLGGLVRRPEDYAYDSHRTYLGCSRTPWLYTGKVIQLLGSRNEAKTAYRKLLADRPPEQLNRLFEQGHGETPGILGSPEFMAGLPRGVRTTRSMLSLTEVAAHVCRLHDVAYSQLVSRCGRRELVLARARIAWYARERGIASLSESARYLRHSASGLARVVAAYQNRRPELFRLEAFASLIPLIGRNPGEIRNGNPMQSNQTEEPDDGDSLAMR